MGIGDEIEEDLVQLVRIREDQRQIFREIEGHADPVDAQRIGDELERLLDNLTHGDARPLLRMLARQRQEVPHDARAPFGRRAHLLGADGDRPLCRGSQQIDVSQHDRQRIVELVSDAGEQLAERRELLALHQLLAQARLRLLGAAALRDIAGGDDHAVDHRLVHEAFADGFHHAPRAVPVLQAVRCGADERGIVETGGAHHPDERLIVGMHELERRPSGALVRRMPEDALHGGTLVPDRAVGVDHDDDVEQSLDERAVVRFALVELLGQTLAIGHVVLARDEVREAAVRREHRRDRLLFGVERAILPAVHDLSLPDAAGEDRVPERGVERVIVHAGLEKRRRAADDLGRLPARHFGERRVDLCDHAIPVGDHDAGGDGLQRRIQDTVEIVAAEPFTDLAGEGVGDPRRLFRWRQNGPVHRQLREDCIASWVCPGLPMRDSAG